MRIGVTPVRMPKCPTNSKGETMKFSEASAFLDALLTDWSVLPQTPDEEEEFVEWLMDIFNHTEESAVD
jgi:hypothetical protein